MSRHRTVEPFRRARETGITAFAPSASARLRILSGLLAALVALPAAGAATGAAPVSASPPASATPTASPDPGAGATVDQVAASWVTMRVETARLENEWAAQRPLLESTIGGLADRAKGLEDKRDLILAKTAKDREDFAALVETNKSTLAELQADEERAKKVSARLLTLRASLPPRLSSALEMSYRSLGGPSLTLAERVQLNQTILNRCVVFNRALTCEPEGLDIPGNNGPHVLEVLYWGLSHGYALDRAAGRAWLGRPTPEGWRWEPVAAAADVAELISIYHDKADPRIIALPARIAHADVAPAANGGAQP